MTGKMAVAKPDWTGWPRADEWALGQLEAGCRAAVAVGGRGDEPGLETLADVSQAGESEGGGFTAVLSGVSECGTGFDTGWPTEGSGVCHWHGSQSGKWAVQNLSKAEALMAVVQSTG